MVGYESEVQMLNPLANGRELYLGCDGRLAPPEGVFSDDDTDEIEHRAQLAFADPFECPLTAAELDTCSEVRLFLFAKALELTLEDAKAKGAFRDVEAWIDLHSDPAFTPVRLALPGIIRKYARERNLPNPSIDKISELTNETLGRLTIWLAGLQPGSVEASEERVSHPIPYLVRGALNAMLSAGKGCLEGVAIRLFYKAQELVKHQMVKEAVGDGTVQLPENHDRPGPSALEALVDEETRRRVHAALRALPLPGRLALVLHKHPEYSCTWGQVLVALDFYARNPGAPEKSFTLYGARRLRDAARRQLRVNLG